MSARQSYLCKSEMIARGWTPALIASLLGKPHWVRKGSSYCVAHLYLKESVYSREDSPEFQERLVKYQANQKKRAAQVVAKKGRALERAEKVLIDIKVVDKETLIKTAVHHYNNRQLDRWCDIGQFRDEEIRSAEMPTEFECVSSFHARLCVNFIRHQMTCYDRFRTLYSAMEYHEAVGVLVRRITEAISEAYPWLAEEANRQRRERYRDQERKAS